MQDLLHSLRRIAVLCSNDSLDDARKIASEALAKFRIPTPYQKSVNIKKCDCEIPKPTDPYDSVDRQICRDCSGVISTTLNNETRILTPDEKNEWIEILPDGSSLPKINSKDSYWVGKLNDNVFNMNRNIVGVTHLYRNLRAGVYSHYMKVEKPIFPTTLNNENHENIQK